MLAEEYSLPSKLKPNMCWQSSVLFTGWWSCTSGFFWKSTLEGARGSCSLGTVGCCTIQEPGAGEVMCPKPSGTETVYCKSLVREGSRKNLFFPPVFPWHPLLTSLTLWQMLVENGEMFKGIIIIFAEQARKGRFGTMRQYIESWHKG